MNDMNDYLLKNWKQIRTKVRKVTKNHQNTDDLLNDLALTLLEKPYEYQRDLLEKNKIQHWFTSAASLQFKSATSPFFYKYKSFVMRTNEFEEWRHPHEDEESDYEEKVLEFIKSELELYTVYERTLMIEHLFNDKSYSEIGREYKINRRFISETITPVKNELFEKVKEKWNI
jgi:DNA-directed RNA polymerase specialized sigma24 family protein